MAAVLSSPPATPVGKIKSFGVFGPKYEVGDLIRSLDDGDVLLFVPPGDSS
jgi:hypothetical protein